MAANIEFVNQLSSERNLKHAGCGKLAFLAPVALHQANFSKYEVPATSGRPETISHPRHKRLAPFQTSPLKITRSAFTPSPHEPVLPFAPPLLDSANITTIQTSCTSNSGSKFKIPAQNNISFKFRVDTACQTAKHDSEPCCRDDNYTTVAEDAVNAMIDFSMTLMYTFLAARLYFDREIIGLPGYAKVFREISTEWRENADTLIDYQRKHGGLFQLATLPVTKVTFHRENAGSAVLFALDSAMRAKECSTSDMKVLQAIAEDAGDLETSELVVRFLSDHNDGLKEINDMVAQVKQVETRHEILALDSELLGR